MKDVESKVFYILSGTFLLMVVALSVKVEKLENELDRCKSVKRISPLSDSIPIRSGSSLEGVWNN